MHAWRHDIHHNGTRHNDTQINDIRYDECRNLSDRLSVIKLSVVEPHVSEKNNMVSVNLLKLFSSLLSVGQSKLVFIFDKPFQPSLIFAGKAKSNRS